MGDTIQKLPAKELFSMIEKLLAENRRAAFTVTGMSMWPFLCHGRDSVIVEKAEQSRLKTGDIVLFRATENLYILHRITYLDRDFFQTTGDGNLYRDRQMPRSCIAAKVVAVIRKGRSIDCSRKTWRILSRLWMLLYPLRGRIFVIWEKIRRH